VRKKLHQKTRIVVGKRPGDDADVIGEFIAGGAIWNSSAKRFVALRHIDKTVVVATRMPAIVREGCGE
jgi:hypothetical protein